ncbi:MAG: hypothetical protein A2X64_03775 [Ignavibacteria bacterium GWF2_33_9]|nr:MAG: hypothetical protein A2X64_03775 [Ignavibacteria bacterium GWF2_33_9]
MELNKNISFDEFSFPTYEEWKEEAQKSLKGADFDKKMFTNTLEGILLKPIYNEFDVNSHNFDLLSGSSLFNDGFKLSGHFSQKWEIAQSIPYNSPQDFNYALKNDLKFGQDAINIYLNRLDFAAYSKNNAECGLHLSSIEDFVVAFDGIDLTKHPVYFNIGEISLDFADIFLEYIHKMNYDKSLIKGNLGIDFFSDILLNGGSYHSIESQFETTASVFKKFSKELPNFGILTIHTHIYHNSGASAIQELAFGLTQSIELIAQLSEFGIDPSEIVRKMRFSTAVGSHFFMEIAKLKAIRYLWKEITKEFGVKDTKLQLHCQTALANKTKYDPWVNILRNSIETLSAIIGNADSIDVCNFDFMYGLPSEFSRRIARNTQLVLANEAHLYDTADPGSGSYFIENLTMEIISKTWELLQEIENQGGYEECIQNSFIQSEISKSAQIQIDNFQSRNNTILGTNKYPNLNERKPHDCKPITFITKSDSEIKQKVFEVTPINLIRFSANFEKLRNNAEIYESANGHPPQIVLINFGDLNDWKPRNDFASDFLQVGGFKIYNSPVFQNIQEVLDYKDDKIQPTIFTICSSDAKYEEMLKPLLAGIKSQIPKAYFILAGYPKEKVDVYKSYGINEFIHLKANIYSTLKRIQEENNISLTEE